MKKFRQDKRGTVTVIVSMMLIPALLLSGTAVDLARIHAARSAAQDANQLAANSILTQYDALLKDLYGLFGVAEYDPILGDMINEYVQIAVLGQKSGDDWVDTGLGTFHAFSGSEVSAKVESPGDYNLGNHHILRRQIEEYMKFRGPVILVEQLLNSFEVYGKSIKSNYEAIEQQEVVGKLMVEFVSLYAELYDAIVAADKCREVGASPNLAGDIGRITRSLGLIREEFVELDRINEDWQDVCEDIEQVSDDLEDEEAEDEPDEDVIKALKERLRDLREEKESLESRYEGVLMHIEELAVGGGGLVGIEQMVEDAKENAVRFKENFQKVVDIAARLDSKREETRREIDELQQKIDAPDCDDELRVELQAIIDEGDALLEQFPDLKGMAETYQEAGNRYIDDTYIPMLEGIQYRNRASPGMGGLTISELGGISSNSAFRLGGGTRVATFAGFSDVSYGMPESFKKFAEFRGDHERLYNHLREMAEKNSEIEIHEIDGIKDKSGSKDAGKRQENILEQLQDLAKQAKDGLISEPLGAEKITDNTVNNPSARSFNMGSDIIEMLSDPAGAIQDMADFSLVLTYGTAMFSNYTTGKPARLSGAGGAAKTLPTESVTGVPMDPKVNYFYQSEWEYLLIGNKDAKENLDAVKDLIFVIRIVCNTIAAFTVKEVKDTAKLVKAAVTPIPYVGPVLGVVLYVATFAAFAAAESTYDLMKLRGGCKVPLLKLNGKGWVMKPEGIVEALAELGKDGDISTESADAHGKEEGISYEQYMLSFFIVDSMLYGNSVDTLVDRMGNLIEWNVVNYRSKANANNLDGNGKVKTDQAVSTMTSAFGEANCFRLSKMQTDFNVTTTIDLRLMFLTMPMFQNQGSPFTSEYPITETDYRGY